MEIVAQCVEQESMIKVMGLSEKGVTRLEKARVLKESMKVDKSTQKSVDQAA